MVQETEKQAIYAVNAFKVPVEDFIRSDAEKVKVRYLVDERHGSNLFSLRLYTIEKGGHTPLDEHAYEHQVYVLSGRGLLKQSKEKARPLRPLQPGDVIFIPSRAVHQFSNELDEPFLFLCVKGNPTLYESTPQKSRSASSDRNFC